ncbi:alpha/beta hydrolase [Streptomyces sp. NPDC001941]|uniref:alpha/beta hydrolase n=1 Tax=Streptomyces sp. NPDC001941 TaxID=3154659 RepID=UPI0033280341
MKPRLVFVHGIGREQDAQVQLQEWLTALAQGAERAGHRSRVDQVLKAAADVRFAYYGDLFSPPAGNSSHPGEPSPSQRTTLAALVLDAVDERLPQADDLDEARLLQQTRKQLIPEGEPQGIGDVGRRVGNAVTTLLGLPGVRFIGKRLTTALMVGTLDQVRRYLERGETDITGATIDQRIRARVLQELHPTEPTIVIAHSLGTVVAFEALHEHAGPVPLFVTMGSPIGLRGAVRPQIHPQPLHTPHGVGAWLNFWDRDDLVAGYPHLEKIVAANESTVKPASTRVDSDGLSVHGAALYLAQPAVAGPVIEALEAVVLR